MSEEAGLAEMKILENASATPADIRALYESAFPDEDLFPLVAALTSDADRAVSLVALSGQQLLGHLVLTPCTVAGEPIGVALLGPLAVQPNHHRQGIGSALVREGIKRSGDRDVAKIFVLGDPSYYRRFGFTAEPGVRPPYALPEEWREAWQSLSPTGEGGAISGELVVPEPWRQRSLWSP